MGILGFFRYEFRRIWVLLFSIFPIIVFIAILLAFRDHIPPSEYKDILGLFIILFFFWMLPVLFPLYIFLFWLCPTYHKYKSGYYYRKLLLLKRFDPNKIDRIERSLDFPRWLSSPYFGPGYLIYIKGEMIPLRIVVRKYTSGKLDYPCFAKEIIVEFPPDDYPPSGGT